MKQILVTGGTGYIGSHTCIELIKAGFEPIIFDNLSNSNESALLGIEEITGILPKFEKVDLKDLRKLERALTNYPNIKGLIHFAGYKSVGESVKKPSKYYKNNLLSLLNLIKVCHKKEIVNIIFSSSCAVYGEAKEMPVKENSPILPASSPYGNTKKVCEDILKDCSKSSKLQVVILRYFNPIGAHPSAKIGELPIGMPQNLVPYITQAAAGIRKNLIVFGKDYPTHDGTCIRDYIYIVDLANAHVKALERLINKNNSSNFEVFNIGTGRGVSVMEVIDTFKNSTGVSLPYIIGKRRKGDVSVVYADNSKAVKSLNWECKTSLSFALQSAWKWQKSCL